MQLTCRTVFQLAAYGLKCALGLARMRVVFNFLGAGLPNLSA